MEPNPYPAWLSQVREITQTPATRQAFEALKNAATPDELAIAAQKATAAVLADIAAEMAPLGSQANMPGFSNTPQPTLLEQLGFTQVSPMNGGVYHVRSNPTNGTAPVEYIALLYSPVPITPATERLQLFTQRVPDPLPIDVSPLQIQTHWHSLDARRLEESGLEPITVDLPAGAQLDTLQVIEYARPGEAGRIRYCVQLPTGDVVCYN
ncbi:hypothetical protein [Massilia sp. 9I]|uniref:hypothetical protein n=1 Tax=Massilia sp. 9I TaxID=2653152 RepID=UPI0013576E78|nr:hypothetical protein [Massilia sp. 9I]